MARVYVERVYGPLYSYDNRLNNEKFPLQIESNIIGVYADLLAVAAQLSWANGDVGGAIYELCEAERLTPENPDIRQLLQMYTQHWQSLMEKRGLWRKRQQDPDKRGSEGTYFIPSNSTST